MDDRIVVMKAGEGSAVKKSGYKNFEYSKTEIASREEFSQVYICYYEVNPGKHAYPKHYHENNTECFYIIEGSGVVETLDDEFEVSAGDVVVFPPGKDGCHKLINTSDEVLKYIDFDTSILPDVIRYPDSGKVGIKEKGKRGYYYIEDTHVDYYEGE